MIERRWRDYGEYLKKRYGQRVYRIGIDAGFSCPNRDADRRGGCIYCDAKGSVAAYQRRDESQFGRTSGFVEEIDETGPTGAPPTMGERKESISRQIERGSRYLDSRYPRTGRSVYFQAFTSTYDDIDVLRQLYDHALAGGTYRELIVSTRPDCVGDDVIALLSSYRQKVDAVWVELGLQSGNDATLRWIGRGHTVADFTDACIRLHKSGLEVCAHVILGLPGESSDEILRTAQVVAHSHPQAIKIHNLHVVAGTRLYDLYREGKVSVGGMERHLEQTILLLRNIPSDIIIQRFVSDTPGHRLAAPRDFGGKEAFVSALASEMACLDAWQGDRT